MNISMNDPKVIAGGATAIMLASGGTGIALDQANRGEPDPVVVVAAQSETKSPTKPTVEVKKAPKPAAKATAQPAPHTPIVQAPRVSVKPAPHHVTPVAHTPAPKPHTTTAAKAVRDHRHATCTALGIVNVPQSSTDYRSWLDTNHDGLACGSTRIKGLNQPRIAPSLPVTRPVSHPVKRAPIVAAPKPTTHTVTIVKRAVAPTPKPATRTVAPTRTATTPAPAPTRRTTTAKRTATPTATTTTTQAQDVRTTAASTGTTYISAPVPDTTVPYTAADTARTATIEAMVYAKINAYRASIGVRPLTTVQAMTNMSRQWSQTMADSLSMSHNPNLAEQTPPSWTKAAENVGWTSFQGTDDAIAERLVTAWLNSPHHLENIRESAFIETGVGVWQSSDGRWWITQDFSN